MIEIITPKLDALIKFKKFDAITLFLILTIIVPKKYIKINDGRNIPIVAQIEPDIPPIS